MLDKGYYQYIMDVKLDIRRSERVEYPLNLRAIKYLNTLEMHPNVTFIIGENGSGKSTLLEGIAIAYGFNPEGGSKNLNFSTMDSHSQLHNLLKVTKGVKHAKDGYFLRAESFYNVATSIDELDLANSYGGRSLHEQSHGESFMALITERFFGNGLYILDEPEAALSPTRQLALMRRIHELVEEDSQFIIATHSPILITYPNSIIYSLDNNYAVLDYDQTEHFNIMRDFTIAPHRMVNYLLKD